MSEEKSTKEKILAAADLLFAKKGFAATSVRDIANTAEVNLAAINYHFKNKESLYWSVFDYNYLLLESGIKDIGLKAKTTEELSVEVFDFFLSGEAALMNTFKIFLSDNVELNQENLAIKENEKFGPPGQDTFLEKIKTDLGDEVTEESALWAVKMIFSLIVHFGVIMNTNVMKKKCCEEEELKPEKIKLSIKHSVRAHLNYIKENKNFLS